MCAFVKQFVHTGEHHFVYLNAECEMFLQDSDSLHEHFQGSYFFFFFCTDHCQRALMWCWCTLPVPLSCQCQWCGPSRPPADSACSSPFHFHFPGPVSCSPPNTRAPPGHSHSTWGQRTPTVSICGSWDCCGVSTHLEQQNWRLWTTVQWPGGDFRVHFLQSLADEGRDGFGRRHTGIALQVRGILQHFAVIILKRAETRAVVGSRCYCAVKYWLITTLAFTSTALAVSYSRTGREEKSMFFIKVTGVMV